MVGLPLRSVSLFLPIPLPCAVLRSLRSDLFVRASDRTGRGSAAKRLVLLSAEQGVLSLCQVLCSGMGASADTTSAVDATVLGPERR